MSNFWDTFGDIVEEETRSGPAVLGLVEISMGYKAYVSGMSSADTFFAVADPHNGQQRKAAKAKAQELGRANFGIQIKRFRDQTDQFKDGQWVAVSWNNDLYENVDGWRSVRKARNGQVRLRNPETLQYENVPVDAFPNGLGFDMVIDSLDKCGISDKLTWRGYAALMWLDDPAAVYYGDAGKTATDQDGNPKFPTVAVVTDVWNSGDEMREALGIKAIPDELRPQPEQKSDGPALPKDWVKYPEAWVKQMGEIKAEFGPLPAARKALDEMGAAEVVKKYGATADEVLAWYGEV